jgi:deoxyribodipyrimidine photo-lyase
MPQPVNIFWFRRDLRLHDNAGLYHALKSEKPVVPIFIFDRNILGDLDNKKDRRVEFIHTALEEMQQQLLKTGSSLEVYNGYPLEVYQSLLRKYKIEKVFTNSDYEQYAIDRDAAVGKSLKDNGAQFYSFKDHVIFEKGEILKDDKSLYTIFTPYSKRWKATLNEFYLKSYPTEKYFRNFCKQTPVEMPSLKEIGFEKTGEPFPSRQIRKEILKHCKEQRDFPAAHGTSRLSVHLRFGTISIRELARIAKQQSETFLNELTWRDFYQMILWQFQHVRLGESCKKEYDKIKWRNNEKEFKAWCEGTTGYPIVDAGMRELNATGFMHNRVRMITASFLTKHLLIDWRWGEAYFAKKLLDYDYASNNGGWQWAAGTGCDAAPYFRIFNPTLQTQKFDKNLEYIKKWVPELNSFDYPQPIVEHEFARKRALEVYDNALKK